MYIVPKFLLIQLKPLTWELKAAYLFTTWYQSQVPFRPLFSFDIISFVIGRRTDGNRSSPPSLSVEEIETIFDTDHLFLFWMSKRLKP